MKYRKCINIIVFSLICMITILGQQKDVNGWQEAKWGMTEDEVLEAFKGEAIRLDKIVAYQASYASIGIINYDISGDKYLVHFIFDENKKNLQRIAITPEATTILDFHFRRLEQLLTEKYGIPYFKNTVTAMGGDKSVVAWNLESTIIELNFINIKLADIQYLNINIHPAKEIWKIEHLETLCVDSKKDIYKKEWNVASLN